MAIRTHVLIIIVNINTLTERYRLAECTQKQDPCTCFLPETHFRSRDTYRLKIRGHKKVFHANGSQKQGLIAIFISDKIGCYKRQRTLHYDQGINLKRRYNKYIYIYIYAPNIGAPQYKQILIAIKGLINGYTVIVGEL